MSSLERIRIEFFYPSSQLQQEVFMPMQTIMSSITDRVLNRKPIRNMLVLSAYLVLSFNTIMAQPSNPVNEVVSNEAALQVRNPLRVITFDFGTLDTLDELGLKESVIGLPKKSLPNYLKQYQSETYTDVGGMKTPDLAVIRQLKPDLIVITGRQGKSAADLAKIAPVLKLDVEAAHFMPSIRSNLNTLGNIFTKRTYSDDQIENTLTALDAKISKIHAVAKASPKKALIIMHNDGKLSALKQGTYATLIYDVLGLKKADQTENNAREAVNAAYLTRVNPDYIFVIDRSAAIGQDKMSSNLLESAGVENTLAYQNKQIVYLTPELWYLSGGGLQSIPLQLDEIATAIHAL